MGLRIEGEPGDEGTTQQTEITTHELTDAELAAQEQSGETDADDGDANLITIGEPPAETSAANGENQPEVTAPEWAKQLRKDYRRLQRELADERRKAGASGTAPPVESALPKLKEPTLEVCGWDEAEYKKQYAAYLKEQTEIERRLEAQKTAVAQQQEAERNLQTAYKSAAVALKVRDFDEAEDAVCATLSQTQQSILLSGCDNPAVVVYALGKNPAKADELAKITNPVKFAVALGKLEKEIKVTPRKPNTKPEPEHIPARSAPLSGGGNTALEAARKKAEASGDYTEVNRLKRQLRSAARG